MSTRGAVGFKLDNEWKVTYNHSDSYPEQLGMRVLEFCKQVDNWDSMKYRVGIVRMVSQDSTPSVSDIHYYNQYSDLSVSNQSLQDWYCLLRGLQGGKILYEIEAGRCEIMIDNQLFMGDGLFCEWAYVIDLDDMTLKVYKGGYKSKHDTFLPKGIGNKPDDYGYYAVKLLYAYDLYNLPEFILGVTNDFKAYYRKSKENQK